MCQFVEEFVEDVIGFVEDVVDVIVDIAEEVIGWIIGNPSDTFSMSDKITETISL